MTTRLCLLDIQGSCTHELTMTETVYIKPVQTQATPNPSMERAFGYTIPPQALANVIGNNISNY